MGWILAQNTGKVKLMPLTVNETIQFTFMGMQRLAIDETNLFLIGMSGTGSLFGITSNKSLESSFAHVPIDSLVKVDVNDLTPGSEDYDVYVWQAESVEEEPPDISRGEETYNLDNALGLAASTLNRV
jgi:hypothetical protein|tara:strand:- start:608 stop:991 length:384 start_codon:yes stop_codon:yes gene_type:complete